MTRYRVHSTENPFKIQTFGIFNLTLECEFDDYLYELEKWTTVFQITLLIHRKINWHTSLSDNIIYRVHVSTGICTWWNLPTITWYKSRWHQSLKNAHFNCTIRLISWHLLVRIANIQQVTFTYHPVLCYSTQATRHIAHSWDGHINIPYVG